MCEPSELTPNESSVATLEHVKNTLVKIIQNKGEIKYFFFYVSQGLNAPLKTSVVRCFDLHMKNIADSVPKSYFARRKQPKRWKQMKEGTRIWAQKQSLVDRFDTPQRGEKSFMYSDTHRINFFSVLFGFSQPQNIMTNHEMLSNR